MKKIDQLTPQQEKDLIASRKKWFEIGTSTEPADWKRAEESIHFFYKKLDKPPPQIIQMSSPMTAELLINYCRIHKNNSLHNSLGESLFDSLYESLGESLHNSLRDSLRISLYNSLRISLYNSLCDSLGKSLYESLGKSLYNSLGKSLYESLCDSLRISLYNSLCDSLGKSLCDSLGKSLYNSLGKSLYNSLGESLFDSLYESLYASLNASLCTNKLEYTGTWLWGSQEAYWISFYLFGREIGVSYEPSDNELLDQWAQLAQSCTWWYPFEKHVLVCDRPQVIHMENERLHCDGGPSVQFRDGWAVWNLHGIRVPQWLAETSPEKLDVKKILALENVDQRREGLRRVPIERVLMETNSKRLDTWKDYELFDMDLGDNKVRRVLKMTNPSVGCFHIERVEDFCKTVKEALAWRNQLDQFVEPLILT